MSQKTVQKSRVFDENGNFFCEHEDCQKVTTYTDRGFNHHLKHAHALTVEQYYRKYLMEEGENLCESPTCRKDKKFIGIRQPFKRFCSNKCAQNDEGTRKKGLETIKVKYGSHKAFVSHVKEKSKETYREKYGADHYFQSDEFKAKNDYSAVFHKSNDKRTATNLTRYGTSNVFAAAPIKDKIKKTNLVKYGTENWKQSEEAREFHSEKTRQTVQTILQRDSKYDKYQVVKSLGSRRYEIACPCGHVIDIAYFNVYNRVKNKLEVCTECFPLVRSSSGLEKEVLEYIRSLYDGEIIENEREVLDFEYEIDIFIPNFRGTDKNLGFEFSGLYWHSEAYKDSRYHLNKTLACEERGIHLIHIWEDDWLFKQDIVKSRINNLLGKNQILIGARECQVKDVSLDETKEFLNENHIQGWCFSKVNLGLYFKDRLVSLMTFGSYRINTGLESKENEYELLRFCNALNSNVSGGASKLFKHFISEYSPLKVRSYCDRAWSNGSLYRNLGFKFLHDTEPGYSYIVDGVRENRFKWRKSELVKMGHSEDLTEREIMSTLGHSRIYDCGNLVYEWSKQ